MTWRLCAAICSAFLAGGCSNTTGGIAIPVPTSSTTAVLHQPPSDPLADVPGVETTLPDHLPPDALVCFPPPSVVGRPATATVSDPAAPKITINVPDGWTSTAGDGDVAMVLAGPDGMTGRVTIASTSLTGRSPRPLRRNGAIGSGRRGDHHRGSFLWVQQPAAGRHVPRTVRCNRVCPPDCPYLDRHKGLSRRHPPGRVGRTAGH